MSLSTAELNSIRALEETWQTSTAIIYRVGTATPDGIGGFTDSLAAIGTVTCDLWQQNNEQKETSDSANQDLSTIEWYITVPFDTDILAKDVVTVESKSFDILSVPLDQSLNSALRCTAISRNQQNLT